jgi:hypothetical protein
MSKAPPDHSINPASADLIAPAVWQPPYSIPRSAQEMKARLDCEIDPE